MSRTKLTGEQQRLALREAVRAYDILNNPAPSAVFRMELLPVPWWEHHKRPYAEQLQLPIHAFKGFSIWCTPEDYPKGKVWAQLHALEGYWAKQIKLAKAFKHAKAATGLAECAWQLSKETGEIVALALSTRASALGLGPKTHNQIQDVAWAKRKIKWLWKHTLPGYRVPVIKLVPPITATNADDDLDLYDYVRSG